MRSFSEVYAALRRANRKQYALLIGCCFFSVLLITAYVSMMRSPTILAVLPEGGDSRKQVMMIFVLAVLGCGVFTTYASGLFFRQKSRETGVLLALGASRAQLRRELGKELAFISFGSCAAGAVLGTPLAFALWQVFRAFVVDTDEMPLTFDPQAYFIALAFSAFVIVMLFFMGARFIRRTNIIDIVQESHKSEPIRDVPRWYGPVGILLMLLGGYLGYSVPGWFILGLHWYPPDGLDLIFYLPAFLGLYMILLHTVVNGWRHGKNRYKHLITTSMMKFQGRQTVRNMLVMTLLIAGAYFGSFYTPMLGTGAMLGFDQRPIDFSYHFRADQDIPEQDEVQALANEYGVQLTGWEMQPAAVLGVDGHETIETKNAVGISYHHEYRELTGSDLFLSESAYNALTGKRVDVLPGTITGIFMAESGGNGIFGGNATKLTNMVTGETMQVAPTEDKFAYDMLFGRYVMDDGDYAAITKGLTAEWLEKQVFFNVADAENSYDFAKALFNTIVDRSGPEVEQYDAFDPVRQMLSEQKGEAYIFGSENLKENGLDRIEYAKRDSSSFRMYWKYMPEFRALDKADFVKTTAVFLMLFIFIAIVCFAAVIVIAFTRCMTIAVVNARVYDDLRHLGASNAYLYQSVRGQINRVFLVPAIVGTALIYAFYMMIMYFNGDPLGITSREAAGLISCLALIAVISAGFYGVYRITKRSVCRALDIKKP